jgi:hypothetical protein
MSATIQVATVQAATPATAHATIQDKLVADAKDMPSLIAAASVADPELAKSLTGKALLASKSTYGAAVTLAVSWVVTHYGIGWTPDVCAMASGVLVLAVSAGLRAFTSGPITGIITKA